MVGCWFMCHTWYFGDHPEDHSQVDSEGGDMGESIMIMENVINITCCIYIMSHHWSWHPGWNSGLLSSPSLVQVAKRLIDLAYLDTDFLKIGYNLFLIMFSMFMLSYPKFFLHPVPVHPLWVLIDVNLSCLCAGNLIKVQQGILMTFSMIMMASPMSPLSTW